MFTRWLAIYVYQMGNYNGLPGGHSEKIYPRDTAKSQKFFREKHYMNIIRRILFDQQSQNHTRKARKKAMIFDIFIDFKIRTEKCR